MMNQAEAAAEAHHRDVPDAVIRVRYLAVIHAAAIWRMPLHRVNQAVRELV